MHRSTAYSRLLLRPLLEAAQGFCTSASKSGSGSEKIIAAVLFERLPVVVPKIDLDVYAFQEFSYRWQHQYRREYPGTLLKKSDARGKGDYHIEYTPAPRTTEADKTNDKRSLQRALDRMLYLLLYGTAYGSNGTPAWHFPEKVYGSELHTVCGVCFKICDWRSFPYVFCWKCSNGAYHYPAFGERQCRYIS